MTSFGQSEFERCVAEAALAPSTHNTQPARWAFDGRTISLLAAPDAALPVADASGHDLEFSCGAALEGMLIALSRHGLQVNLDCADAWDGQGPLARLTVTGKGAGIDPLAAQVAGRFTCRSGFAPASEQTLRALEDWADAAPDIHLIREAETLGQLSAQNDALSLSLFHSPAFRDELMLWSRLSPGHPRWTRDGLNARALGLSRIEALAMPWVMKRAVFGLLSRLGLARQIVSEGGKWDDAAGVFFLSAPQDQPALQAGRRYYRVGLELAALGFATWPMSVIIDDAGSQAQWRDRLCLDERIRLVSCLRVGIPQHPAPDRARRPLSEIIIRQ